MPSWRRSRSGPMKSSFLTTHENCDGSVSLTRRIRNSKKPSRMLVRSWKHLWLLLCPAKLWRRMVGVVHPKKLKQDLRVFWRLMNPKECVWENSYRLIMKTILQGKGDNSLQLYLLVHKFIPMPQAIKNSSSKSSSGQGMGKIGENFRRGTWQVRSKKEVIDEARTSGAKVHFASLMDFEKMLSWRQSTKSTKVELYSEMILSKTIQGLTQCSLNKYHQHLKWQPPKVMDIISRLTGCDG